MNRQELRRVKTGLEALLAQEQQESRRLREAVTIERSPDPLDAVIASGSRDQACSALEASRKRIGDIQGAIHRAETGTYGMCIECEEPIAQKRLVATDGCATLCVHCQSEQEQARSVGAPVTTPAAAYGQWALA